MTPGKYVKSLGIKTIQDLVERYGVPISTLEAWYYNRRPVFDALARECVPRAGSVHILFNNDAPVGAMTTDSAAAAALDIKRASAQESDRWHLHTVPMFGGADGV